MRVNARDINSTRGTAGLTLIIGDSGFCCVCVTSFEHKSVKEQMVASTFNGMDFEMHGALRFSLPVCPVTSLQLS